MVTLPQEILNHISEKQKVGWNFSGWIRDRYRQEHMVGVSPEDLPEEAVRLTVSELTRIGIQTMRQIDYSPDHPRFSELLKWWNEENNHNLSAGAFVALRSELYKRDADKVPIPPPAGVMP